MGGGGTWSANIRGGVAGKSEKLAIPGVRFLKMIPCPGTKPSLVLSLSPALKFARNLSENVESCRPSDLNHIMVLWSANGQKSFSFRGSTIWNNSVHDVTELLTE